MKTRRYAAAEGLPVKLRTRANVVLERWMMGRWLGGRCAGRRRVGRRCLRRCWSKMRWLGKRFASSSGQSTVEAAFMLPVAFLIVLLLVQPGIVLYDRMVMRSAAAEGCRLLATAASEGVGDSAEQCEAYVKRRLGSIPPQDCFHVHEGGCTWSIELEGSESSQVVSVSIATEVKPLPLLDAGAALLGAVNERGNLVVKVSESYKVQPDWVASSPQGQNPAAWVGAWLDG